MKIAEACAVVTGGASGLGRAVVQRVLAEGGRCALLDVNEEQGSRAAAALGERALFIRTDVGDERSVNAAIEQARKAMGRVNLAVSCAGILGAELRVPTLFVLEAFLFVWLGMSCLRWQRRRARLRKLHPPPG